MKLFPGKVIPPIPSKKKKSFENEFIKKRRIFLEEFLNQMLMIDQVKNSQLMVEFLYLQNEQSWKQKQKDYEKISKIDKVEQICNSIGSLDILVTPQIRNYNNHHQQFLQTQEQILSRTRKLCKQLEGELNKVASTIFRIGDQV